MILEYSKQEKVLKKYGLKRPRSFFVTNKKEAISAADKIGYPVVLKISSRKHLHRTEVDGVAKNVRNKSETEEAYERLKSIKDIDGVIVEKKIEGFEFIIGVKKDPVFGSVLMLGTGGIMVELFKDVTFRALPVKKNDAMEMLNEIKGRKLLDGFRGTKKIDKNNLINLLIKISDLAVKENFKEIDFNPVIINNKEVLICDVKIYE